LVVADAALCQSGFQRIEQGVKGGSVAQGYVVHLILGICSCGGRENIDLHHVFDEAKVAAGFTVAVDEDLIALDHGGGPFGDDCSIRTVRVLAFAEHVEIAQTDGLEAVGTGKDAGVQFIHVFGHRIGRQRTTDLVFHFGQIRVVAIGGAGGGVGEAADLLVLGGHQHVQEAVDVGLVGGDGVLDGARHGAQGGLVEDVVCPLYGLAAVIQVADVAFDEAETGPLVFGDQGLDFVQVMLVARGEVVQAYYCLVQL